MKHAETLKFYLWLMACIGMLIVPWAVGFAYLLTRI